MPEQDLPEAVAQTVLEHIQVGRDFITGDITVIGNSNQVKAEFFEPNLERFSKNQFVSPKQEVIEEFIQRLRNKQLIILYATDEIDISGITRNLIWSFQEKFSVLNNTQKSKKASVKEWQRSADPSNFEKEFLSNVKQSIYILNKVLPEDINYRLSQFQQIVVSSNHFVVISTNRSLRSWKLSDSEKVCWYELPVKDLYDIEVLLNELKQNLKNEAGNLIDKVKSLKGAEKYANDDLLLKNVVEQLGTPDKIFNFTQQLAAPNLNEDLEKLIEIAKDNRQILDQWFRFTLKPREQLIALGLNFFDGLYEDQCLTAIGEIVKYEWHRREPSLKALDYGDIEPLQGFFRLVDVQGTQLKSIESRFPKQRYLLFKVALDSYRLRIQTALPVLRRLINDSTDREAINRTTFGIPTGRYLYGSREDSTSSNKLRRDLLRSVISEAISDLGLIDLNLVQDTLLHLACSSEKAIQTLTAHTIARWKDALYNKEKHVVQILTWLYKKEILEANNKESKYKAKDCISATIVTTIGYVSKHYNPNELPEELHDLLRIILNSPNEMVLSRLRQPILRLLVPQHFIQLKDELFVLACLAQEKNLLQELSYDIELVFRRDPIEVNKVLSGWYSKCTEGRFNNSNLVKRELESVLTVVSLTYIRVLLRLKVQDAIFQEIARTIHGVFLIEKASPIRHKIIEEIKEQTRKALIEGLDDKVRQSMSLLKVIVETFSDKELKALIEFLAQINQGQVQKVNLKYTTSNENRKLPRWFSSNETLPLIEQLMFEWLKDDGNIVSQITGATLILGKPLKSNEILSTLIEWRNEYKEHQPSNSKDHPSKREFLIVATAILALKILVKRTSYQSDEIYQILNEILVFEWHPYVRRTIVQLICYYCQQKFYEIIRYMKNWMANFRLDEVEEISNAISSANKRQLEKVTDTIDINESSDYRDYLPVWWTGKRELTPVENEMLQWLLDRSNIRTQAVGAQLLLGHLIPEEHVLPTLTLWYAESRLGSPQNINLENYPFEGINSRQALILATALFATSLAFSSRFGNRLSSRSVEFLKNILNEETNSIVRNTILKAIFSCPTENLEKAESLLKEIFLNLKRDELQKITIAFSRLYNSHLEKTATQIQGTENFPFWWNPGRPLIHIEKIFVRWLLDPKNSPAQIIAARLSIGKTMDILESWQYLNLWFQECEKVKIRGENLSSDNKYAVLLSTVSILLLEILNSQESGRTLSTHALHRLTLILQNEENLFVRKTILNSIIYYSRFNLKQMQPYILHLGEKMTIDEILRILLVFEDLFPESVKR